MMVFLVQHSRAFLNFFDSSIHFELSFMNMATDAEAFERSIAIRHQNDEFNDVRDEYSKVLLHQMEAGNNGLTKTKYLTFGIRAESMKAAKPRLMHKQFHMGDNAKFNFNWKYLVGFGLSVKDFIAPSSFEFPNGRTFKMGDTCA